MSFIAGLLTFILVINCLVLILLVLVQLPKKDAGAGIAFGGGAADALFGAGSGNALTKITKYATIVFFALALLVGYLQDRMHRDDSTSFVKGVQQQQMQTPVVAPSATPQPVAPAPAAAVTTNNLLTMPLTTPTNASTPAK
ncbi:MAG: preprotein translocase subunit SecG [Limisphaerales bacterium]